MAISLHGLGSLHYKQGEYERARQLYQQSLAINQELGDRAGVATAMAQMGLLLEQQGNLARAVTVMVQALQLFEQLAQPEAEQARSILARLQQRSEKTHSRKLSSKLTTHSVLEALLLSPITD
jgi:tetratricopeptide (TPR) repeat protein